MKSTFVFQDVAALLLSGAILSALAAPPAIKLLGDAAPESAAARTVMITPKTKSVNVVGGETIKFVAGDKSFTWNFDVPATVSSFDLNRIAPAGVLDHKVRAYVAPNPTYSHY
jgi:Heavy-metal resistance protein CzcE